MALPPHRRNKFTYKVIDPTIREILRERSILDNTQQIAMPFVKATTTVKLPKILGANAVGFTLGIQMLERDFKIRDIYASEQGKELVGYTYEPQGDGVVTKSVFAEQLLLAQRALKFLDNDENLFSDGNGVNFIPPPGITNMSIGTNKSAYSRFADISISVPTKLQLEMLHRTFLIPACGMILEWGQQFAPKRTFNFGESGLSPSEEFRLFPWYDHDQLLPLLERLGKKYVGLDEIYENYVLPSRGQYNWMYGDVASFNVNSNSDGSYECSIRIVGPNESSLAYAVRNTYLVPTLGSDFSANIKYSNSIESYFNKTTAGAFNFKTILEEVRNGSILPEWNAHVQFFPNGNRIQGTPDSDEVDEPSISEDGFVDSEDAFFITWRFFVNIILNDETYGLKAIFKNKEFTRDQLDRVSLLRPYKNQQGSDTDVYITDPYENYVGNNKYLRSTDPSTMLIVNKSAADASNAILETRLVNNGKVEELYKSSEKTREFEAVGDFHRSIIGQRPIEELFAESLYPQNNDEKNDRGFLSTGVWINHKAIIQCMLSSRTVLEGINKLLQQMSAATNNYWKLAVDDSEPDIEDVDSNLKIDYGVVDLNFAESSDYAVQLFLQGEENRVHVFNKYIRDSNGQLVGSDVIDCKVDLSFPKLLFSQIATLGSSDAKDVARANEEDDSEILGNPTVPGAGSVLKSMFSITTLSTEDSAEGNFDLTKPRISNVSNTNPRNSNTQITTNAGGRGQDIGPVVAELRSNGIESGSIIESLDAARERLNECLANCVQPTTEIATEDIQPPSDIENYCVRLGNGTTERFVCDAAYTDGITDVVELSQFMAQVGHESINFRAVEENLNYSEGALERVFSSYFGPGKENAAEYARNPEKIANYVYADENRRSPLGNNNPGDGFRYRGRGYIQLTGKANYRAISRAIGVDVVENPDYLTTPEGATESALWYWKNRVRTRSPNFGNTETVRRIVNGGTNGLDDTVVRFNRYLRIFTEGTVQEELTQEQETFEIEGDCSGCDSIRSQIERLEQQLAVLTDSTSREQRLSTFLRNFEYMNNIFKYIEAFPDLMTNQIYNDATDNKSNAFGAAPGSLSIKASLTLPGISGLRVGELFWIDRIPAFYKAFGAFMATAVVEELTLDGWTTKIDAVFYYLGREWTNSVTKLLVESLSNE